MTVSVKKLGGSVAVVIPKAIAQEMRLVAGTSLEISASAGSLVMRKQGRRARRSLDEILRGIKPSAYRKNARQLAEKHPVGREIW